MKTICLIIPSLRHGGAERVISVLANEWAKNPECEVNLLLLTKQDHFYKIDSRVNIIEPDQSYTKNILSKLIYTIWVFWFIRSNINKINPSAILSFCERYNNIVLLALLGSNKPVFISDRNNPNNHLGFIHEFLRKKLYKNAKGIIAQTETAKKILAYKTRNKNINAIPNPLRTITEQDVVKENIIINVGRFEVQKNQKELIEIFANLKFKENWKLIIVGVGSLKEELQQLIQKYNLSNQVELVGFKENIDAYFQQAKIFAFTSIYEGFPNALSEAMANGLAPIAYDCPTGPSELIKDKINGFLIPLHQKEDFMIKLQKLIDEESLRDKFSEKAKLVNQTYSTNTVSQRYLKFITE